MFGLFTHRFYDVNRPIQTVAVVDLDIETNGSDRPSSHTIHSALNECSVAVECSYALSKTGVLALWVLLGSGEILLVRLSGAQLERQSVDGPLLMLPRQNANFGLEHCALLVLRGEPELLVLCSSRGDLYHFLLFHDEESQGGGWQLRLFDQIQLELLMHVSGEDASQSEDQSSSFSTFIRLCGDPWSPTRYFCVHGAGAHTVTVPWHADLQRFLRQCDSPTSQLTGAPSSGDSCAAVAENDGAGCAWQIVSSSVPSRVCHLLSTLPLGHKVPKKEQHCVPVGWMILPGSYRGGSQLVLLLPSAHTGTRLLDVQLRSARSEPPLSLEALPDSCFVEEPLKRENFEERIRRLLVRESSQPLLQ